MANKKVGTDFGEMEEIIDDFLVEADELTDSLDNNFVKLEGAPENLDLLNEIFRAAHTIKGTSSFLGFDQVTELAHKMEDVLNMLRRSELALTPEIMDSLLEALDLLKNLLDIVRNKTGKDLDLTDILKRLVAITDAKPQKTSASTARSRVANGKPKTDLAPVDTRAAPAPGTNAIESSSNRPDSSSVREPSAKKRTAVDQTIRVDVDRLDTLMNMMGELVLGRNSLVQAVGQFNIDHERESEFEPINQAATTINFITTELQMAVMKMRMQPVGKVFNKFPRLVRDLARDSKKQIELKISGESTEVDKSVIEEIGDPLVHLLRNACDHGLESPKDRKKAGKSPTGTIHLDATQEGSHIVIKVNDDGRGFDADAIRAKAIERGLATAEAVERMPDREVIRYIFEAGFSTAKKVTDVSGRGVGMDVVRTNIEKLNGAIDLSSVKGKGSEVLIKLPLTLAIIQGLLVESDDDVFVLPLSSVWETVKTDKANISYVNQRPVLRLREEIIPIINLVEILNGTANGLTLTEKPYIVVVGLADKKLGIIIDRFLGQEEVVIKSLGNYLGATEGIAGATILGDGRIRLIVDLIGLFSLARKLS